MSGASARASANASPTVWISSRRRGRSSTKATAWEGRSKSTPPNVRDRRAMRNKLRDLDYVTEIEIMEARFQAVLDLGHHLKAYKKPLGRGNPALAVEPADGLAAHRRGHAGSPPGRTASGGKRGCETASACKRSPRASRSTSSRNGWATRISRQPRSMPMRSAPKSMRSPAGCGRRRV